MKKILLVVFILLTCSSAIILLAQVKGGASSANEPTAEWGTHGLEINNTLGNTLQQNPKMITTSDGNYLAIWEDGRFGFANLYAQKLDSRGNRLWETDGVIVCNNLANQTTAQLVADNAGGAIIVWQDFRQENSDLYVQRLSAQGEVLWGGTGKPLCLAAAGQFAPEIATDGYGGAIITWHDYRSGSGEDVYAQRVAPDGKTLWTKDGLLVCGITGTQWYPKIASDGKGGAFITWGDGRVSASDNNIYIQHLDFAGKALWEKDGVPICSAPQNQERPEILATTDSLFLAWNDSRGGTVDIYAQKLDFEGQPLWAKDGVPAVSAPYNQKDPRLADDNFGGLILVFLDFREEEGSVVAQRLNRHGAVEWGESGRRLARSFVKQDKPLIINCQNSWVFVWEDFRDGWASLFAQKFNSSGTPLWEEGGIRFSLKGKGQENACAAATSDGGLTILWQDRSNGTADIIGQQLSADGALVWDDNGLVVCNTPGLVTHQNVCLITDDKSDVIMVFEDARTGYVNIYAQKISPDGVLLWGKDGLPVAKARANQANPQIVADGRGGAIVAWEDQRDPSFFKIYAQHLAANGRKVWESGSKPLTKLNAKQSRPLMTSDGNGGALVFWQDERNQLSLKDLYGQRISGSGELLWDKNGQPVCLENGDQTETAAVPDGTNGAIITWADYRHGERNPDIYAQRVASSGKITWDKDGVLVCGAPDIQRTPKVAVDSAGSALVVWTDKGGGSYDIYAQRLNAEGKTQWTTDGLPLNQTARTQQNPLPANTQIVVWEDYRYGNWDVFANAVSAQGRLLWGEEGIPISSLPLTQYSPQVIGLPAGSALVAWEDYREGKQYEIYYQKVDTNGKVAWQHNGLLVQTFNGARAPKLLSLPESNSFVVVWEDYTGGGKSIYGQKFRLN